MAPDPVDAPATPDPIESLIAMISSLDPMALRAFMESLTKKERETVLGLAENDPELYGKIQSAMPLPANYEPNRPRWYKKPPKPDIATVTSTARKDYAAYQVLRERFKDDVDAYFNRTWGRFKSDQGADPYFDESTAHVGIALSSEINMRAAILAEHDITYTVPPMTPDLEDETQKEENFLYYMDDLAERRHANRAGGSFKYDVAWNLQIYGRAIVRRVIDLNDSEDPMDEVLIDPATACPIWGGKHGLLRLTRWYSGTVFDVCRDYDVAATVLTKPKGKNVDGQDFKTLSIENTINVIEWWDDDWYGVFTEDGRTIKAMSEHKYGEVPFIVQLVSRGLPSMFSDPSANPVSPSDTGGARQRNDLKMKGLGAIYWLKFTHRQREAFYGKIYDALLKSDNPPIWLGMDTFAKSRAASKLGTRRGKVYPFDRDHEAPQVPQYAPMPSIIAPLMQALGDDWGMSALPMSSYGVGEANQSGAAVDGLTEGGNSKLTVDALAMTSFYQRRAEQTLRFWRDWGRLVEDEQGRYGSFSVPVKRKTPHGPASFELTPDIIERTGTRVRVRMTNIRMAQLGAIGAAYLQLVNGDLMTERDAIERLGNPNPEEVMSGREYEKMRKDPRSQDLRMLAALLERTGQPIDPQELADLQTKLFAQGLIAQLSQGSGQSGPPGSAPPPQGGPSGQGNPMSPGVSPPGISAGVAMGDYGMPPGSQGGMVGRPPMP